MVSEGKVLGIVNVNDISDFSFSSEELGGKKAYMKNISQRKGLPKVRLAFITRGVSQERFCCPRARAIVCL